jgi:hypothetical protein
MRGLDATVQDALQGYPGVINDYPGLTAIRLNVDPNHDSTSDISKVVQEYNSVNVVVEIEDHMGTENEDNVGWYTQMATLFKNSPLVFLEVPNEPKNGLSATASNQVGIINAIRQAGFTNPVGLQPLGGYDESNLSTVVHSVGTQQIFVTPHIYYDGTDSNAAAQYVESEIQTAASNGLYTSIDEFGNAMDGVHLDPVGDTVIEAVITANEAGKCGALFWAMDNGNHSDGADSAFLTSNGNKLTSTGEQLVQWLSQTSGITQSAGLILTF